MNHWQERLSGFYSDEDLNILRNKTVFVPGCGAIGSYVLNILVRTGITHFIIADFDVYKDINLPGQLFCHSESINRTKTETAAQWIRGINPQSNITIYGKEWTQPENLHDIMEKSDIMILGFDTLSPGVLMYRTAREYSLPIVDFYYGTLLSAFLTLPGEPVPEERFGYPTLDNKWEDCDSWEIASGSLINLSAFVLSNAPWIREDFSTATLKNFLALGKIPVLPSLVSMAGCLMADSAIEYLLGRKRHIDYKGFFFDWRRGKYVKPADPAENEFHYHDVRKNLLSMLK